VALTVETLAYVPEGLVLTIHCSKTVHLENVILQCNQLVSSKEARTLLERYQRYRRSQ
jgi:hypothetical protein